MKTDLQSKNVLNPGEAIELFHLSRRKFRALLDEKNLPFLAFYGTRKIILREEFEKYLGEHPELRARPNYVRKKGLPIDEKFLITTKEAAELFQLDPKLLRSIAMEKKSKVAVKSGRTFLFHKERLAKYLEGRNYIGK